MSKTFHELAVFSSGLRLPQLAGAVLLGADGAGGVVASSNGGWATPTVAPPWSNGSHPFQFFKDAVGVVHLRGEVTMAAAGNATVCTLPPGFRPGITDYYPVLGAGAAAGNFISISITGVVTGWIPGANGSNYFNGLTFLAEN